MKKIKLIIFIAAQLVFPALTFAHDDQYGTWPGMMGWGHSMGWPMMIVMLLFWSAVLVGIVALIRFVFGKSGHDASQPAETVLDILKMRYAKGEIDKEEFEEKKRVLKE